MLKWGYLIIKEMENCISTMLESCDEEETEERGVLMLTEKIARFGTELNAETEEGQKIGELLDFFFDILENRFCYDVRPVFSNT